MWREEFADSDDYFVGQARRKDFAETRQDSLIDSLNPHAEVVTACLAASIEMRRTRIEARTHSMARTAAVLRANVEPSVAAAAPCETRQQVALLSHFRPASTASCAARGHDSPVGRVPQLLTDDPQVRGRYRQPLGLGTLRTCFLSPAIALARPVPDNRTPIQLATQHLMYRGWNPGGRTALLRARRRHAFLVQPLRDPLLTDSVCSELKYATHDRSLCLVDAPLGVRVHADVVIAEHAAVRDVTKSG
jgi:hypothetical protein